MTDLISKSAVMNSLSKVFGIPLDYDGNCDEMCDEAFAAIDALPSIDAVPVVRCKDCKHWKPCAGATEHVKCCEFAGYMIGANGYCVYGEVKEQ